MIKKLLLRVGLITKDRDGEIHYPIHVAPLWLWKWFMRHPINMTCCNGAFYLFRNVPGVIKWLPGRLLPRRWGFGLFGLVEFGDRGALICLVN